MSRRSEIDLEPIDSRYLHKLMRSLFPKKNDFASTEDLEELLPELGHFGITTKKQVRLLLKQYRRWVLNGEKSKLDAIHQRIYREELGEEQYLDSMRRQYWFAYPAIIRQVMEQEFGKEYEAFSNERDSI